ncbi:MAG: hypothetical protein IE925_06055 [Rhodobacterales bacterium]|nr:hypothetical protein [Rhodobacterales bacterium]
MASQARKAFDENASDIKRLIDLHLKAGGDARGRRYGLEVLNKSAIVLITAFWEAYCEDIAEEALRHIVEHSKDSASLPEELKKQIAKEIKSKQHDLAVWELSGDGWRTYLLDRFDQLTENRNRKLNTPKTAQIDSLFLETIGIRQMSRHWKWPRKMTVPRATEKLDKYVTLRGAIAHRGSDSKSVTKAQVTDYFEFIRSVVAKTGGAVNAHVRAATGKPLWE